MPLELTNPRECPPGGWTFHIPELTGKAADVGPFTSKYDLLVECRHRYCNNALMPPADLSDRIDAFMCAQPKVAPRCRETPKPPDPSFLKRAAMTLGDAVRGTLVLAQWQVLRMTGERVRVTPSQAEARAAICVSCDRNGPIDGCYTCHAGQFAATLLNISDGQRLPQQDALGGCSVCGCGLAGKVWMEKSILLRNLPASQRPNYPPHCWLVREDIA